MYAATAWIRTRGGEHPCCHLEDVTAFVYEVDDACFASVPQKTPRSRNLPTEWEVCFLLLLHVMILYFILYHRLYTGVRLHLFHTSYTKLKRMVLGNPDGEAYDSCRERRRQMVPDDPPPPGPPSIPSNYILGAMMIFNYCGTTAPGISF